MRNLLFSIRRLAPLCLVFLFLPAVAVAQNAVVRGTVTSADRGSPLAGVNVVIPELNLSVLTSDRGQYSLTIPAARIPAAPVNLTARAIGYKAVQRGTLIRAGEQVVDFALQTDINRLEEIIVTGVLEGVERGKVPFSVGRLAAEDIPVASADPIRVLAGKVAGLRVGATSGRPGTAPEIMLRGPRSINATGRSQEPLIIVDGVIQHVGSLQELGGLDIETVEVVKGAAGSSLYGTQAANGVITITTKRGSGAREGVVFNVRTEWGFSDFSGFDYGMPKNHPLQLDETGKRFCVTGISGANPCSRSVDLMTEMLRINNVNSDTLRTPQNILYGAPGINDLLNIYQVQIYPNRYYNSLVQISDRRPTSLTSVDATGKVGNVGFYVSGQFTDDPGGVKFFNGSEQKRGRVNLDYQPRSDLTVSVSTMYNDFYRDNRLTGIFGTLLRGGMPGFNYLARDTLGRLLVSRGASGWRPTGNGSAAVLYDGENRTTDIRTNRFLGSLNMKYFPTAWVTFEGVFGYDNRTARSDDYVVKGYRTTTISTANNNGNLDILRNKDEAINAGLSATFRRNLSEELEAKVRVGGYWDQQIFSQSRGSGQIFLVKDVPQLDNLSANQAVTSQSEETVNAGYSAALDLDYKDRYILSGSFRRDGSSRFGPDHRWASFNRIAGVWRTSEEPWWNLSFMDDFRIRASRGTAGSTPRFSAQYETYNVGQTGISTVQAGNSKLEPEVTTEYETGVDFTLFRRVGVEATFAKASTRNQILLVNVPAAVGYSQQWQNAGTLQNTTWELGVTVPIVNNDKFYWQARATWDRTRTFITELFTPEFLYDGGSAQGTGSFFFMTADSRKSCLPGEVGHLPGEPGFEPGQARPNCTGPQLNKFGNIYGRRFLKNCNELHSSIRSRCGPGQDFQVNDRGYLVYVGQGNTYRDGITKNLWQTTLPAAESPWGIVLYWGHPIVDRPLAGQPGQGVGINQIIGNTLPDFRFSFSNDFQWKKLTLYTLLDATVGHDVNNQGEGWGLLDLSSANFDQEGQSVETAKPVGYSWRAGPSESTGTGGFYDTLNPNNYVVEDASYAKLREVSLTYKLGAVRGFGDWTLGIIGRNLLTISGYSGYDPEVGCGGRGGAGACGNGGSTTRGTGSGLINQTDAFDFPTLRTFTFLVSTRF
jgi:TonB-linked SusC/RagA family outer membrane protein